MSTTEVLSRINEIQSMFKALPMAATTATGAGKAGGAAFSSALAQAESTGTVSSFSGTTSVTGEQVLTAGKKYLGVPYVWGGTDPAKGLDCSGFVQRTFKDVGITLPRVSRDQAKAGEPVASLAQAKVGDLVAFGSPVNHIGIYAGNNKMIVAPHTGDVVKIQNIYKTPTAIRRVLPDSNSASVAAAVATRPSGLGATGSLPASTPFRDQFVAAGQKYGVSPRLLAAVAKAESGFNPNAVSGAGARGLMQIMPGTARELGVNPMNPTEAINGAAKLLKSHLSRFGSTELALAAYNAGPGAVNKYNGVPPYGETQNYVKKVIRFAQGSAS
jgi:soluble lytic murein transglycosylase-like protein